MKVLVAHSGWQHSAHLASALEKAGMLDSYITTVYDTPKSALVNYLKKVPSSSFRQGIATRHLDDLDQNKITCLCTLSGLLSIVLSRLGWRRLYELNELQLNYRFGKKVAKLAARKHADAIIMYEGKAAGAFKWLKGHVPGTLRIIDSASACSIFVGRKMADEYKSVNSEEPFFAPLLLEGRDADYVTKEIDLADRYLVASSYVKRSFVESGLAPEKVMVCANGGNFPIKGEPKSKPEARPLRFVYCGRCTPQKGVHHLLEAFKGRQESLRLVGVYDRCDSYLERWAKEPNIEFTGKITHHQVINQLDWADVFIFPSLSDGFSFACAEALCRGLPLVCTDCTGISDFISEGVNGFVIPAGRSSALADAVNWFSENPERIPVMSAAALETAGKLTWERYDKEISDLFYGILVTKEKGGALT
ncbi:glycosyltransferase family 4 protein [Collinsella sp. An268]|uniref:glycosyltransferase family 4 protein n=1 Tax=Collinsella sp. An268 TaxID=1965612 RepID=UPI000B391DBB|nr:glycosyltransferase family 4 protein [Collinsella sp. An268]OUO64934.1 hypothetical protein B5F70_02440 [Collinsella sp. An268]